MRKIVGSLLAVLMALTAFAPALAVQLKDYPGFLAETTDTTSSLAAYIIIGADAAASDVVGAVNLALRLAELQYTVETVPGVPVACIDNCVEREIAIGDTNIADDFPSTSLKQVHVAYLKDSTIPIGATYKRYHEEIVIPTATASRDYTKFNESVAVDLTNAATPWEYKLVFDEAFNASAAGYGDYYPLTLEIMGQEFGIVSFGSNSFTAQVGTKATLTWNTPQTIGDYTYTLVNGDTSWVSIRVEQAGSVIYTVSLTAGEEKIIPGTTLKIKALAIRASTITNTIEADIIVGEETQKTYTTGDEFPGNPDWKFDISINPSAPNEVSAGDYIGVKYQPDLPTEKYIMPGNKLVSPNDYMEIAHNGYTVSKYATLTIKPASGVTIYDSTEKVIGDLSGVYGFEITSDNKVLQNGAYQTAYIVFKQQGTSTLKLNATLAYVDPAKGNKAIYYDSKIVATNDTTAVTPENLEIPILFDSSKYTLKLLANTTNIQDLTNYLPTLYMAGYDTNATAVYGFKSSYFDVEIGGVTTDTDVSTVTSSITYDNYGTKLELIAANAALDQVVFSLPADQVKIKVAVGKIGEVIEGEQTYRKIAPIRTAVAKLDTDADVAGLKTTSNLILVGGPCVNDLTAELATAGKLVDSENNTLTCEGWPGRNFAIISAIDDAFTTGKVVIVVAGTRAEDTRAACAVLQKYEDYLSTVTSSQVEITGTITSPTVTPF